jgi:transposase
MAVVQLRHPTKGRAYYDRKVAAGKSPMEAMRALKRRLSNVVFRQMKADAHATRTGPGGHTGAATGSSAAGSYPNAGTSEKSLPGPATSDPTPPHHSIPRADPAASRPGRTAVAVKRPLLDGDEDRLTLKRREQPPS